MAYKIPQPIKTFPGGAVLPVLPAYTYREPAEGKRYVPIEIDWDGNGTTYELNMQGLTTQTFSQLVMFDVDNSKSGAPVTFYFPDSSDTLVVPSESGGLFPVFTGGLTFYAAAPNAFVTDVTRLRALNYRQEPIALPPPEFSQTAAALNLTAGGTTAILPPSVSGTLTSYNANLTMVGGGGVGSVQVALVDHATSQVIDQGELITSGTNAVSGIILNTSDVAIRFAGGLDVVVTVGGVAPSFAANVAIRYRTP